MEVLMKEGAQFERFGCVWIVDKVYELTPEQMQKYNLVYRRRVKAHVIDAPKGYLGIREFDMALPKEENHG